MAVRICQEMFQNLDIPVIVCRRGGDFPVLFTNTKAMILLDPALSVVGLETAYTPLSRLLRLESSEDRENIRRILRGGGSVTELATTLCVTGGERLAVTLYANSFSHDGDAFCVIFFTPRVACKKNASRGVDILLAVLNASFRADDIDGALDSVLGIAGNYIGASRAYVFEFCGSDMMRNSYEWCAPGIVPAIDDLQSVRRGAFGFNAICGTVGVYISDDTRRLPEPDRDFLARQGIKALAILPLYYLDEGLGYIGFDDCVAYRRWDRDELSFLQSLASIVASMINRRNAEVELARSREILQTITDNIDSVVYVNDLHTYEIRFINAALARALNKSPSEIIGKLCWQVIQKDQTGPCPFCPIPKIVDDRSGPTDRTYEWEFRNTLTEQWYFAKDSIIKWIDGDDVHIETAIDITYRKRYEEKLQFFASTDIMTGVYNREWGYKLLAEAHRDMSEPYSLCFIDLDGLKKTNDTFGHGAGDDMIRDTLGGIRACVRREDILCRWGGDEFILLLRCAVENAHRIVGKIERRLAAENTRPERQYPLSFSYGIVDLRAYPTVDDAVKTADGRMYEQKESKRGRPGQGPSDRSLSGDPEHAAETPDESERPLPGTEA